jgi:hypothetical protein
MPEMVSSSTLEFLSWLASRPRTYEETIAAWRTNCPRLSIWEDALADGLVRVVRGANGHQPGVVLTLRGDAALRARVLTPTR